MFGDNRMQRLVVAMTGASGTGYAIGLLRSLQAMPDLEVHLIVSRAALKVLPLESELSQDELLGLAGQVSSEDDIGAPPASGSWRHSGMIVCPCSMASLAAISSGLGSNLIHRAADVTLKERRPLILVPRETPLHAIHLQNMLQVTQAGGTVLPACPGFYHRPATVQDLINHVVGRILDQFGLEHDLFPRWGGESS